ncbi:MAG: hypothetical protein KC983_06240 [Phycisphaerales bacterium]|nr:hypothetical protein [Phycisphaerales bacterium]
MSASLATTVILSGIQLAREGISTWMRTAAIQKAEGVISDEEFAQIVAESKETSEEWDYAVAQAEAEIAARTQTGP